MRRGGQVIILRGKLVVCGLKPLSGIVERERGLRFFVRFLFVFLERFELELRSGVHQKRAQCL